MVMERPPEVHPPSGRVPGQELLLIPIFESRRRNISVDGEKKSSSRVFGMGYKYRPKGAPGVTHLAWPRRVVAWSGGGTPLAALRASGVLHDKIFLGIFLEFSEHFVFSLFSVMHGQKQTETGTGH